MKRTDEPREVVYGFHPVAELLDRRPQEVERIWVVRGAGGRLGRLARIAREAGVPVTHVPREVLDRRLGQRAVHQGVAAAVAAAQYAELEPLYRRAETQAGARLLFVDRVVDPGNLGALVRTAAAAGCDAVVVSSEGTAGLTAAVFKASAGAVERIPVARDGSMPRSIERLRQAGFLAVALDPRGPVEWYRPDWKRSIIIVAGSEERGVRPGILRACDQRVRIPLEGGVESLNVAVAAGVLLFDAVRQRRSGNGES